MLSSKFTLKYPDVVARLHDFCSRYNYKALILVGIEVNQETSDVQRDLALFSALSPLRNLVIFPYLLHHSMCRN